MVNYLPPTGAGRDCTGSATPIPLVPLVPLRPRPLEDEELREEIDLLFEVMVTVSGYPKHLTSEQVDAALQLPLTGGSPQRVTPGPIMRNGGLAPAPDQSWAAGVQRGAPGSRPVGGARARTT